MSFLPEQPEEQERLSCSVFFEYFDAPGSGISVTLEKLDRESSQYEVISTSRTGTDGRINTLISEDDELENGWYRLTFDNRGSPVNTGPDYTVPTIFMLSDPKAHYYISLRINGKSYTVNVSHI